MVYFVSWYLHNAQNDGWAYKVENKYTSLDAAQKAYFGLCQQYIGGEVYNYVTVVLSNALGSVLMSYHWEPERGGD